MEETGNVQNGATTSGFQKFQNQQVNLKWWWNEKLIQKRIQVLITGFNAGSMFKGGGGTKQVHKAKNSDVFKTVADSNDEIDSTKQEKDPKKFMLLETFLNK